MARRSSFQSVVNSIARDAARRQRIAEQEHKRQIREIERQYQQRERMLYQQQREAERLAKEAERTAQQASKTADKATRDAERAAKLAAKEAREKYLAELAQNAADRNAQLAEQIEALRSLLEHTLKVDDAISFDSLRQPIEYPPFQIPAELSTPIPQPQKNEYLSKVIKPGGLSGMLGITRKAYERALVHFGIKGSLVV